MLIKKLELLSYFKLVLRRKKLSIKKMSKMILNTVNRSKIAKLNLEVVAMIKNKLFSKVSLLKNSKLWIWVKGRINLSIDFQD